MMNSRCFSQSESSSRRRFLAVFSMRVYVLLSCSPLCVRQCHNRVYDGNSQSSVVIGTFCGIGRFPFSIVGTGTDLLLEFVSSKAGITFSQLANRFIFIHGVSHSLPKTKKKKINNKKNRVKVTYGRPSSICRCRPLS